MFLISFPYRLALSHCHGLFLLCDLVSFLFSSLIVHLRKGHTVVSIHHGKKREAKSSVKKEFFVFLSHLNCPLVLGLESHYLQIKGYKSTRKETVIETNVLPDGLHQR